MMYEFSLVSATLVRRYKRFLADVDMPSGEQQTVHCPNTGSMLRCMPESAAIWLLPSINKKRKYPLTWEWVLVDQQYRACINPSRANILVREALGDGFIPSLFSEQPECYEVKPEPRVADGRLDFAICDIESGQVVEYIEVKSVTLKADENSRLGLFPDAKTDRGVKHLKRLKALRQQDVSTRLIFCVMHEGIDEVGIAESIDPEYAVNLTDAYQGGVAIEAYGVEFIDDGQQQGMAIKRSIPVTIPAPIPAPIPATTLATTPIPQFSQSDNNADK